MKTDLVDTLPDGGRILPLLSPRQCDVLMFLHAYAIKHRDFPTISEIAEAMGISKQAVAPLINGLIRKGYAFRDRMIAHRNLRLTEVALEKLRRDEETATGDLFEEN